MGFCDFKDVVAFGNNQLWRPLAAKVKDHHSGLPKKMVTIDKVRLMNENRFNLVQPYFDCQNRYFSQNKQMSEIFWNKKKIENRIKNKNDKVQQLKFCKLYTLKTGWTLFPLFFDIY